jgi:hypothetical protein
LEYNKLIPPSKGGLGGAEIINNKIMNILSKISGISHFMEVTTFSLDECKSMDEIFDKIYTETAKIHLNNIK